jgi:hypothetical protein
VEYSNDCVLALLPRSIVAEWADSDQVTIEGEGRVRVLVEKDFQCLHGIVERDPDAWPNPMAREE